MRHKHGDKPSKKNTDEKPTKKRAESTPKTRASHSFRSETAEKYTPGMHPVDQSWRGWDFEDWLNRPTGRCELLPSRGKKLSEPLIVNIGRMLSEGLFRYHVESLLGTSERGIERWLQTAKVHEAKRKKWSKEAKRFETKAGAKESLGPKPPVTLHMQLKIVVAKAEAIGETTLFGALVNYALDGDAKTAQWLLERKYPQRYGRFAMRPDIERDDEGKVKKNAIGDLADALNAVAERAES